METNEAKRPDVLNLEYQAYQLEGLAGLMGLLAGTAGAGEFNVTEETPATFTMLAQKCREIKGEISAYIDAELAARKSDAGHGA